MPANKPDAPRSEKMTSPSKTFAFISPALFRLPLIKPMGSSFPLMVPRTGRLQTPARRGAILTESMVRLVLTDGKVPVSPLIATGPTRILPPGTFRRVGEGIVKRLGPAFNKRSSPCSGRRERFMDRMDNTPLSLSKGFFPMRFRYQMGRERSIPLRDIPCSSDESAPLCHLKKPLAAHSVIVPVNFRSAATAPSTLRPPKKGFSVLNGSKMK